MPAPVYIILLDYIKPIPEVDRHLAEHRAYLDKFYEKGIFITSGRRNPLNGGVIIARGLDASGSAISKEQIGEIMENDPFLINKVASYKITEFTPVKYSDDFKKILGMP